MILGSWSGLGGFGFGGMATMMLFMIVFWVLFVACIIYVSRLQNDGTTTDTADNNNAIETLRERYATGNIDTQEYEERKRVLLS